MGFQYSAFTKANKDDYFVQECILHATKAGAYKGVCSHNKKMLLPSSERNVNSLFFILKTLR